MLKELELLVPIHNVKTPFWLAGILFPFVSLKKIHSFILSFYQIRRMVDLHQPDLVISFTPETTVPMASLSRLFKRRKIKWIISEDSNTPEAINRMSPNRLSAAFVLSIFSYAYQRADFITTVSAYVKDSVRKNYGVSDAKMNVIRNPFELAGITEKRDRIPNKTQLTNQLDCEYIIAVGRLVKVKRLDLLLRVFVHVRKTVAIKLLVLGEGPELGFLQKMARRLGIEDDVVFTGYYENPWVFMRHAKMLVLTSKSEGFGNVLVEAMLADCLVVSTRSGGPEEIIVHNETGVLVPDDHGSIALEIIRLLNDPERCGRIKKSAYKRAQVYSPETISQQFRAMFEDVLANAGRHWEN